MYLVTFLENEQICNSTGFDSVCGRRIVNENLNPHFQSWRKIDCEQIIRSGVIMNIYDHCYTKMLMSQLAALCLIMSDHVTIQFDCIVHIDCTAL